jgi:endonuclease YncB( thermonuclease family)
LIASRSVSELAALKVEFNSLEAVQGRSKVLKKAPDLVWSGAFFVALLTAGQAHAAETGCDLDGDASRVKLARVVDGDTLRIEGGGKLRVIGVNAPEKGDDKRAAQPFSRRATEAVRHFLANDDSFLIRTGLQEKDRYGRSLVHVYRNNGQSLAEFLLREGLAFHIVIPPNLGDHGCLWKAEQFARERGHGIWGHDYYSPAMASELGKADTGFRLVTGRVTQVSSGKRSWWIELDDRVSLRLSKKDEHYFDTLLKDLQGKPRVEVRGWLIWRGNKSGHPPLLMHLRHPMALRILSG